MSRSYYEQKAETAALAEVLMERGWNVTGYTEDRSDTMSDYFAPAYWSGEATFPATGAKLVTRFARAKEVPNGKSWALLDKTGKRIACGVNVKRSGSSVDKTDERVAVRLLAEKLETLAGVKPKRTVARLVALAAVGRDLWMVKAALEGYGPNDYERKNATPEKLALIARIEALTERFFKARTYMGKTENDRRKMAAMSARDAGNRINEAVDRRLKATTAVAAV